MEKLKSLAMLMFDGAFFGLYSAGKINFANAIANADSRTNLGSRNKLLQPKPLQPTRLLDRLRRVPRILSN